MGSMTDDTNVQNIQKDKYFINRLQEGKLIIWVDRNKTKQVENDHSEIRDCNNYDDNENIT